MANAESTVKDLEKINEQLLLAYQKQVMQAGDQLRAEHKKFVDLVEIEGWRKRKAYQEVYPEATDGTAQHAAYQIFQRPEVQIYCRALKDYASCQVLGGTGWKKAMLIKVAMRAMTEEKVFDREGNFHGEFSFRGDWVAKAIDTLNRMDGDVAASKHELSGPGGGPIQTQITGFEVVEYDDEEGGDDGAED